MLTRCSSEWECRHNAGSVGAGDSHPVWGRSTCVSPWNYAVVGRMKTGGLQMVTGVASAAEDIFNKRSWERNILFRFWFLSCTTSAWFFAYLLGRRLIAEREKSSNSQRKANASNVQRSCGTLTWIAGSTSAIHSSSHGFQAVKRKTTQMRTSKGYLPIVCKGVRCNHLCLADTQRKAEK